MSIYVAQGANALKWAGGGGGYGDDPFPLHTCGDAYMEDHVKGMVDAYGIGAVVRVDAVASQKAWVTGMTPAGSYSGWNSAQIDRLFYWCAKYGAHLDITAHYAKTSSSAGSHWERNALKPGGAIPHIFSSGKMDGLYHYIQTKVAARYMGSNAQMRPGQQVTLKNGSIVTVPALLTNEPVVKFVSPWNEPNSIGSCGGLLDGADTGAQASNWQELGYRIHRETLDAFGDYRAANVPAGEKPYIGAFTMGSIDFVSFRGYEEFAAISGSIIADADTFHVHVYQHGPPRSEAGGTGDAQSRHINTCQTSLQPYIRTRTGGSPRGIVIDEGVCAGGVRWNRRQLFAGIAGKGKAEPSDLAGYGDAGRILWPAPIGWPGYSTPANQSAGHTNQLDIMLEFWERADELNAMNPSAEIICIVPHIQIQIDEVTSTMATTGGMVGGEAWHRDRSSIRVIGHPELGGSNRYTRATGTPWRSPHWKPWLEAVSDYWYAEKGATKPGNAPPPPPPPGPPVVVDVGETALADTSVTLNGTVNPVGKATTYQFKYGLTTAYGSVSPASPASAGSGSSAVAVSRAITGLIASTIYHYRLEATNIDGLSVTADGTFTTLAAPPPPPTDPEITLTKSAANLRIELV